MYVRRLKRLREALRVPSLRGSQARNRRLAARRTFLGGLATVGLGSILPFARSSFVQATPARPPPAPGDLAAGIKGPVIVRGESRYEEWRQSMVWQMYKPDRYPALIVRPTSVEEIQVAMHYARRTGLKVAVKSGGHHEKANFLHDGGMLLDLWNFRGLEVDPGRTMAWAGPALPGYQLDHELARSNLAFPVAHAATVPLGGFLLGSGICFNPKSWGHYAFFSVLGADVVTADGELRRVTPERHPDLYWALRGGGVSFPGVVTRFHLQLYPRPGFIAEGQYVFPVARIAGAADWLTELAESDLPKTELRLESGPLECILRAFVFADSETEARSILDQLAGHPMVQGAVQKSEFLPTDLKTLLTGRRGGHQRFGLARRATISIWTDNLKELLVRLGELNAGVPTWRPWAVAGLSTHREPLPDAAFSEMGQALIAYGMSWTDAAEDAARFSWIRRVEAEMQPFVTGYQINMVDVYGNPQRLRRSFSPEAWARLRSVRKKYDPKGVFHDFFGLAHS